MWEQWRRRIGERDLCIERKTEMRDESLVGAEHKLGLPVIRHFSERIPTLLSQSHPHRSRMPLLLSFFLWSPCMTPNHYWWSHTGFEYKYLLSIYIKTPKWVCCRIMILPVKSHCMYYFFSFDCYFEVQYTFTKLLFVGFSIEASRLVSLHTTLRPSLVVHASSLTLLESGSLQRRNARGRPSCGGRAGICREKSKQKVSPLAISESENHSFLYVHVYRAALRWTLWYTCQRYSHQIVRTSPFSFCKDWWQLFT